MWPAPGLHRCSEVAPVQEAGRTMATAAWAPEAESTEYNVEGVRRC